MNTLDKPRLLLIVSIDFGELANALYFVQDQPFEVMLALPPRLHSVHGQSLSVPACEYRKPEDLLHLVESFQPHLALLCSGYLFGVNGIFDASALHQLVDAIQKRRCHVVTTDPFLGLFKDPSRITFGGTDPLKAVVADHFRQVAGALSGLAHLYPVGVPKTSQERNFSFFNPKIVAETPVKPQLHHHIPTLRHDSRIWMFVLSAEDCNLQLLKNGGGEFAGNVIRKLNETASAGRQAVLVAPQTFLAGISARIEPAQQAVLLPFCPLHLFQALLLRAEYAFFWNIYSNAIFHRVANGLPVIFFDLGHIAQALPGLHQRALPTYYGSAPLPMHPQDSALSTASMVALADKQREPLARTIAGYRRLPSPAAVIDMIMRS